MIRKSELTKEYYSPSEVGTLMGKCQRVISDMVRAGKLEAIRSDTNRIMIPKEAATDLLDRSGLLVMMEIREEMQSMPRFFSRTKNRGDLERQVLDIMNASEREGLDRPILIRDTGSGLNKKKKG